MVETYLIMFCRPHISLACRVYKWGVESASFAPAYQWPVGKCADISRHHWGLTPCVRNPSRFADKGAYGGLVAVECAIIQTTSGPLLGS